MEDDTPALAWGKHGAQGLRYVLLDGHADSVIVWERGVRLGH